MVSWTKYPEVGRRQILDWVRPSYDAKSMENIETAYMISKYGHRGQVRDDGLRYFEHPKAVFWIFDFELGLIDWRVLVMCLLHDVREDTFILSDYRIQINFGTEVASGVGLLTKDASDYLERLRRFGSWRVLMVKVADRVHNVRTLDACTSEKRQRKVAETKRDYLPLADLMVEQAPKRHRRKARQLKKLLIEALELLENVSD